MYRYWTWAGSRAWGGLTRRPERNGGHRHAAWRDHRLRHDPGSHRCAGEAPDPVQVEPAARAPLPGKKRNLGWIPCQSRASGLESWKVRFARQCFSVWDSYCLDDCPFRRHPDHRHRSRAQGGCCMLEWHPARRPKALSNAGTEAWQSPACTQKAAPVKTIQAFSCCGAIYSGPRNQDTGLRYAVADFEGFRDVEAEA